MREFKKKLLIAVAVLLVAVSLCVYWFWETPLKGYLPDGKCTDVALLNIVFEGHISYTVSPDAAEQIINCLGNAELNHGLPFKSWRGDAFQISIIYDGDIHTWISMTLLDDGRVLVFNGRNGKQYFFRDGEVLYSQIAAVAADLPET